MPLLFSLSSRLPPLQVIGCEDRLRNDLYYIGWGVKLCSTSTSTRAFRARDEAEAYQLRGKTEPRYYCLGLEASRPRPHPTSTSFHGLM